MSGVIIRLTPEIREEMRGLKATGLTCGEVAAEVEKRHGLRPSSANVRLICRGIAPQYKGRKPGAPGGSRPRAARVVAWDRLLDRAKAEANALAEDVIGLAAEMEETYIGNLKRIRHRFIEYLCKAKEESGGLDRKGGQP
jgi:hypothetical protein